MCLQASYAQESSYFVFQQPDYQRDCKEVLNACSSTHNTSRVYLIKPDGYPEPFKVFCDNDLDTGGWTDGEFYVNSDCTSRSVCSNNQLIVGESYHCSDDATCDVRDDIRRCYCIDGYEGNGVNCTRKFFPKDCQELYVDGSSDGDYTIYPDGWPSGIQVNCEMESNVGGWTVSTMQQQSSKFAYICS
ncbi:Techylectin-5B [Apostichopus japonicus]|uniref:Techylectin-5B n=1 Tax=Stichopus japonicus TaxID=307972 RepID=A0A2G8LFB1_STIJA|nr:Techylectin-5B [Apostichopus japonicus]